MNMKLDLKLGTNWNEYTGTKQVYAVPMYLGDYNNYRKWEMPEGEDPFTEGYMIEYKNGGKPNHPDHRGYISWSPKEVFEQSYKKDTVKDLSFSDALIALKQGSHVRRAGWNGKNQTVSVMDGQTLSTGLKFGYGEYENEPTFAPTLMLHNQQNFLVLGWVPSIGDLFANDWEVL